jgi:hypothetical protein
MGSGRQADKQTDKHRRRGEAGEGAKEREKRECGKREQECKRERKLDLGSIQYGCRKEDNAATKKKPAGRRAVSFRPEHAFEEALFLAQRLDLGGLAVALARQLDTPVEQVVCEVLEV